MEITQARDRLLLKWDVQNFLAGTENFQEAEEQTKAVKSAFAYLHKMPFSVVRTSHSMHTCIGVVV